MPSEKAALVARPDATELGRGDATRRITFGPLPVHACAYPRAQGPGSPAPAPTTARHLVRIPTGSAQNTLCPPMRAPWLFRGPELGPSGLIRLILIATESLEASRERPRSLVYTERRERQRRVFQCPCWQQWLLAVGARSAGCWVPRHSSSGLSSRPTCAYRGRGRETRAMPSWF